MTPIRLTRRGRIVVRTLVAVAFIVAWIGASSIYPDHPAFW